MKLLSNATSLLAGMVIGAGVVAGIGATVVSMQATVGRYQIMAVDQRAFVIDTVTGQVWQKMADVANSRGFADPKIPGLRLRQEGQTRPDDGRQGGGGEEPR